MLIFDYDFTIKLEMIRENAFIFIFACVTILPGYGCKLAVKPPAKDAGEGNGRVPPGAIRALNANELGVAKRVCLALEQADWELRRDFLGTSFDFKITQVDCQSKQVVANPVSLLVSEEFSPARMQWDGKDYTGSYLKSLPTLGHGPLDSFCSQILADKVPLNTVDIVPNVEKAQFTFIQRNLAENHSMYQVTYYVRNKDGQYARNSIREMTVYSGATSGKKARGINSMEKYFVSCPDDANKFQVVVQENLAFE